jgi:phosphoribosylpyrophosphate synthetase
MKPLVFHLPGDEDFADGLIRALGAQRAALQLHRFPDGESLVRLDADVTGRTVVIVASLAQPDAKALPLLFAADAARDICTATARSARSTGCRPVWSSPRPPSRPGSQPMWTVPC